MEISAYKVRRYEEPSKTHKDASLAGLIVAKEIDLPMEDDREETDQLYG